MTSEAALEATYVWLEQIEKRRADKRTAKEADELPPVEIEKYLLPDVRQVFRYGYIRQ